jgi:hypothetical protein
VWPDWSLILVRLPISAGLPPAPPSYSNVVGVPLA